MTRPFIYQFIEESFFSEPRIKPTVEYSTIYNLNVLAGTDIPAIGLPQLGTSTFTKAGGEGSDTDKDMQITSDLATQTFTRSHTESSDSDLHNAVDKVKVRLETECVSLQTWVVTGSEYQKLLLQLSTRTITETRESTDSDHP